MLIGVCVCVYVCIARVKTLCKRSKPKIIMAAFLNDFYNSLRGGTQNLTIFEGWNLSPEKGFTFSGKITKLLPRGAMGNISGDGCLNM